MHVVSYSDARRSLKAVLDRVANDHDATLIHRRGGENAVILSETAYTSMVETIYLLCSPANARALMTAIEQDRQGKTEAHQLVQA
ncbi:MAG: type II toxin-antitoxin system prevent-host-death family antitoxin [Polaromonas sp.]